MTLKEMMKQRASGGDVRRQAVVVLSDGDDTTSLVGFDDVLELAQQSGVAVYTITARSSPVARTLFGGNRGSFAESEYAMQALAQESGARASTARIGA